MIAWFQIIFRIQKTKVGNDEISKKHFKLKSPILSKTSFLKKKHVLHFVCGLYLSRVSVQGGPYKIITSN